MITIDYSRYSEGQKAWADSLQSHPEFAELPELGRAALASISRMRDLSGRREIGTEAA